MKAFLKLQYRYKICYTLIHLMKRSFKYFLIALTIASVLLILFHFTRQNQIKIGLAVTLTGVYPDLGREIRDGALLAVELINENGGINGKKVRLIIKDNKYNSEIAKMNYEKFLKEGVVAVIGPATSTTAKNILPLLNEKKLLSIAPTPTSTELAGLDDYLLRLRPTNKEEAETLADYIRKNPKIKKIAIVYDVINPTYTEDFIKNFRSHLDKNLNIHLHPFDEKKRNIKYYSKEIINQSNDAVILLIDVYNAALFIQCIKSLKPDILIFTTIWTKSPRLIEYGGKYAEGVLTVDIIEYCKEDRANAEIRKRFFEKYGRPMSYASINGFDAVMIIKKAIENGATQKNIKETILKIKKFEGLQGEIIFDEFGDRKIKPFILRVENNEYRRVAQ